MNWRAFRLSELHQRVDEAIRAEQRRRFNNPFEIKRLKKLKLAIKDRLVALSRQPGRAYGLQPAQAFDVKAVVYELDRALPRSA